MIDLCIGSPPTVFFPESRAGRRRYSR